MPTNEKQSGRSSGQRLAIGDRQLASLPDGRPPYPASFKALATKVDRERAKTAWNAAIRITWVCHIWEMFLLRAGHTQTQLDAQTLQRLQTCVPELVDIDTVLTAYFSGKSEFSGPEPPSVFYDDYFAWLNA